MKKAISLVFAMMFVFAVSAWAEDGTGECPVCPKSSCATPRLCQEDQSTCGYVEPCNPIFYVCECGDGKFWKNGDMVGVSVTSLTEGVYWYYGQSAIKVKLFPYLNETTSTTPNIYDACDWRDGVTDDDLADPTTGPGTGRFDDPNAWDFIWNGNTTSLIYLDADGDKIKVPSTDGVSACELEDSAKIVTITTCTKGSWILDVTAGPNLNDPNYDEDDDGFQGEDGYLELTLGDPNTAVDLQYLLVDVPAVAVDWAEVEAAGLLGTTAQAKVCILNQKDADAGLCTSCVIVCCCTIDTVKLCNTLVENCIYFPYALYGQQSAGWATGVVVTNTSLDNSSSEDKKVAIDDMVAEFTIVDQTGAMFTKTYSDFTQAITAFNVDDLVDNVLGLTGVAPGNLYIKVKANFNLDGYFFNLLFNGDISFGAGALPRECAWPYGPALNTIKSDVKTGLGYLKLM